jgi:hypothetical protein
MSLTPKSPLLKKRAMDALLESMTTDNYDSLGAHRRGESTPESKGTEFGESLNGEGFSGSPAIIPPKDLAPPSSQEDAEFFKESQPKVGVTLHRNTKSKAHTTRCTEIAKAHPDWDTSKVEAQATLVGLGVKPIEDVLSDWHGEEKEAREITPIEEDKAEHEFFKEAPVQASAKAAHGQFPDSGQYDFEHEDHVRKEAKQWAQYAEPADNVNTDDIKPFDPDGNYLCGTCDMRQGTNECMRVDGPISFEKGSCRLYHRGDPENQPPMEKKFTQAEAKYAEQEGGFGCHRCEYGSEAKAPDPHGRKSWCAFWGMHIVPLACCADWDKGDKHKDASLVTIAQLTKSAAKTLYHVTSTDKAPSIKTKGILPLQTSNWVKGDEEGERYGEGEIFAMDNAEDAVRWAAKMDWEFNRGMGTGKISIITFTPGQEKWKRDTSDPISQAANKGRWLKAIGSIKPEQIGNSYALTSEMVKSVTQGKGVKLSYSGYEVPSTGIVEEYTEKIRRPKAENRWHGLPDSEFQIGRMPTSRKPSMEEQENSMFDEPEFEKEADVPTKSYGMGTPIGGTDNPDAGASDEPEELQDPGELSLNMTGSEDDEEYDNYDYDAEDRRLAAIMDEEDAVFDSQARLWASEVDGNDWDTALSKIGSTEDSGWFSKSARPTDQKVELLQKQFKLTPEQIEECIKADPSPNQTDYVAWLAKHLAKGAFKLPEDAAKLTEQLGIFQKLKKSPAFTFSKDIQQYDPPKLFETLEQATVAGMGSKKEEKRERVRQGAEIVVKQGDITIYKVTEPKAAMELGSGTNWCTAPPGNTMAAHYLADGPLYIFFDAGSAVAQLHPESNQFMNRADVCMLESVTGENSYSRSEKFLADPSLAKALGLLAEKEPKVREWVTENVSDPDAVAKILGEESQKEVEHNTQFDQQIAEYNKELAEWQGKFDQYQKDHAEWQDKQKAFQATPQYQEWQKQHDAYQKEYDEWWRNRYDPVSGEYKTRPVEPQEPEGPEEPQEPSKPWNPAGDRDRGYSYRTRYGEPQGKKFTMQVRHALATGKALPPELEAQLVAAHVNTNLLLKYGALFHPGQPWEPLAVALFDKVKARGRVDKEAIDYASKFIKGPWPELEPYLLEKLFLQTRNMEQMRMALDYAARGRRSRWPEFEAKLLKEKPGLASGYGAAEYAIRVLKQPWSAIPGLKRKKNGRLNPEECMIVGNPGEARRYSEAFFQGKSWDDFQRSALEANNLAALINYAADTLHARMPELEEKILSGQKDAQESKGRQRYRHYTDLPLDYSIKVIKGRWPEYEQKVLSYAKNTENSKGYGHGEYKPSTSQRWGERSRLDKRVANYVKQVIKGRWPELEQVLLARYQEAPALWAQNQNMLDGYLVTINEACQQRLKDNREVPEEEKETGEEDALGRVRQTPDERKQKPFTIFQQDPQCYWPEGEQRLVTRDPGYEKVLTDTLRERASGVGDEEREQWKKENKYVSPEDLVKMERPAGNAAISYEEQKTKPDYTIWNGLWIGWYGMDEIERYTDYMLANNVTWKEGVDILEFAEDLEDVRGRYSWKTRPQRRQQEAAPPPSGNYVQDPSQPGVYRPVSSLLRKKGLVEMHETPTKLPPRDDMKEHLDQQEQDLLTKDTMQGVVESLNPKKKKHLPQIDPRINPDGVVASKTAEYTQQDADEDEEYFLEQVSEAEDEAKRFFMQEDYLRQEAQDRGISMDALWDMVGEEYTAEFYGYPYKRVHDFTDEETEGLEGKDASSEEIPEITDVLDEGKVYVQFLGDEVEFDDAAKAVRYAESISAKYPGTVARFCIDEGGVVTEDTYVNGQHVGETVEKWASERIGRG